MTAPHRAAAAARLLAAVVCATLVAGACSSSSPSAGANREVIEVFGPYRNQAATNFVRELAAYAERANVEINYTGSSNFVGDLRRRVADANPPDVAMVPQVGLILSLAELGQLVPLAPETIDTINENFDRRIQAITEVDGEPVGVLYRANVKSLVWYRPSLFAARGYEVPATMDELERLADQMVDDGLAPWCISIEAGGATGWAATDWVEDLLLRSAGADTYQAWVDGEVDFADPAVQGAFEQFRALALERGRAAGGLERVLREPVQAAHLPLFESEPGCGMHRQASFAADWLPSGVVYAPGSGDLAVFVLPPITADEPAPLVIGGDHAVAFSDRPAVADLMTYLASEEATARWPAGTAYFSPRIDSHEDGTGSLLTQLQESALADAQVLVFDGSDSMAPDIGADLFWREITAWVGGTNPFQQLAATLDDARERSE